MTKNYLLAHEIGHRFALEHTFSESNNYTVAAKRFIFTENKIDNFMDYSEKVLLDNQGNPVDNQGNSVKVSTKNSFFRWQKNIALGRWRSYFGL